MSAAQPQGTVDALTGRVDATPPDPAQNPGSPHPSVGRHHHHHHHRTAATPASPRKQTDPFQWKSRPWESFDLLSHQEEEGTIVNVQ